jgi:hypothetical protein
LSYDDSIDKLNKVFSTSKALMALGLVFALISLVISIVMVIHHWFKPILILDLKPRLIPIGLVVTFVLSAIFLLLAWVTFFKITSVQHDMFPPSEYSVVRYTNVYI